MEEAKKMAIFDIFSKRQKRLNGEVPDIYSYEKLPQELRTQIVHIWLETLGSPDEHHYSDVEKAYKSIVDALCREYGVFYLYSLDNYRGRDFTQELVNFFLNEESVEKCLDAVELSFRLIDRSTRRFDYLHRRNASEIADGAIRELNQRFREHGIGYQYSNGEIIRVDSELIHTEVVKPVLKLLNQKQYAGAQEEFLKAHEHYRHGNAKEALNECLKAFESTMKAICEKRGWSYNKNASSRNLIKTCFDNGLVPGFWQSHYSSLISLLESSVPTGRNKLSGHGQGTKPLTVPDYLVSYMLHMTASTIVFLTKAEEELP